MCRVDQGGSEKGGPDVKEIGDCDDGDDGAEEDEEVEEQETTPTLQQDEGLPRPQH